MGGTVRKAFLAAGLLLLAGSAFARGYSGFGGDSGYHAARGYFRSDGTYVARHYRTYPNGTKLDNWSARGNANPFAGRAGTIDPYRVMPRDPTESLHNSGH
jgi:hypothetical protein